MIRTFLILSSALMLSACVSPTNVVKPLDLKNSGTRNIQNVQVTYSSLSKDKLVATDQKMKAKDVNESKTNDIKYKSLKDSMEEVVKLRLQSRDNDGNKFANVEIEVDNFKLINPVAAVLVGSADQLSGTVRIHDSATKELLTEFYVDVLKGTGGLLGLAIRGGGRS